MIGDARTAYRKGHQMATVRYVEINGERIELGDSEVLTESRCDSCGEFVKMTAMAIVTLTVSGPGLATITTTREGHVSHITAAVGDLLNELFPPEPSF